MEILIIIGLILLNGFFSMSEIAIVSARKSKLMGEAKSGSQYAAAALKLIDNPTNFLSTVQIGITLIGILTGIYSGATLANSFARILEDVLIPSKHSHFIAQTTIIVIVTYVTIVFGELIPKRIGMSMGTKIAKVVARPMQIISLIATPFVWILSQSTTAIAKLIGLTDSDNQVTEEEIKSMINEGFANGEVTKVEQDIMERVFNLGDRDIESLMTPRTDIVWIDTTMSNSEITNLVANHPYNTYPVANKSLDQIIGIVSLKDLFGHLDDDKFCIKTVIKQALFLHEGIMVYNAFDQMKENQSHYAIVCDEYGSVQGIVTDRDIFEGLVGKLPDINEEPVIIKRKDNSWLIDGQCEFYYFLEYFNLEDLYAEYKYNTLSGLILDKLGYIPKSGEIVLWNDFSIEIVDMDNTRIDKLLIRKNNNT